MLKKREGFRQILLIELEDLVEDIKLLVEKLHKDKESENISNYVFMENLALMENERMGVTLLREGVGLMDPASYESLEALEQAVLERYRHIIKDKGLGQSGWEIVKRKMDKVRKYVDGEVCG